MWASQVSQWQRILCQCRRRGFDPWVGKIFWRRKRQPTPVLLPGESHRWRSLVGYSPWGAESETTEWLCGVAKSRTRLSDFTFTFSLLWNHKGSLEARRSSFSLGELRKCFTRKITWTTFESRTCETWNSSTQLHSRRTQWMDARRADLTAAGGCRFWATCLALWWTAT